MKFIRIVDLDGNVKKVSFDDFVDHEFINYDFNTILKVADIYEEMRMPLYHELLYMAIDPYHISVLKNSKYYKVLVDEILCSDSKIDKIYLITYHNHYLMYDYYKNENDIIYDIKKEKNERISGVGKVQLMLDLYRTFSMIDFDLVNDNINPLINEDEKVIYLALEQAHMEKDEFFKLMMSIKCACYEELNNIRSLKEQENNVLN